MHNVGNSASKSGEPDSQDVVHITTPENLSDRDTDTTKQTSNLNKAKDRKKKKDYKKTDDNYKKTSVLLRKDLYKELKKASIDTDRSLQDIINEAIEEWIKRYKKMAV